MATRGSFEPDLPAAIDAAARKALHYWGRSLDDLEDLKQDLWEWYLSRPKTREFIEKARTQTGVRNAFGRHAWQMLSERQSWDNVADARAIYSSEAVKSSLANTSTNQYLAGIMPEALDKLNKQNAGHREAIRARYDRREPEYGQPGAKAMLLNRATISLTTIVNRIAITDLEGEENTTRRGQGATGRQVVGLHSDPTADMAFALIKVGDDVIELQQGGTTTMRELFEEQTLPIGAGGYGGHTEWLDLFEGELNDRTDMYRHQVFPDLYPNEQPMLVGNWHPEDLEAYVGGEYTPGYRRLRVVK